MKLTISKQANLNYLAKIVRVDSFSPHPNADKLKLTNVDGCITACSIDTEPGVYIYFPVECCINYEYLQANNLYRHTDLNANKEAKPGFFEDSGRVKCVKLRGFASEGLIMPMKTLISSAYEYDERYSDHLVGTEFDTVDDQLLVKKYVIKTKGSGSTSGGRKAEKKYDETIVEKQFRFHPDTEALKKNLHKFGPETVIQASAKFHGTSAVSCKLLTKRSLSWKDKLAKFFGVKVADSEYTSFCSSRKVIKDPKLNPGLQQGFYNYDIWNLAHKIVEPFLINGQTLYYEIVGYLPTGNMIQKDYDYGCRFNEKLNYKDMTPQQMLESKLFDIYIYRSTYTNVDGRVFEMSPKQLQEWCQINGLPCVKEFFYGIVDQFMIEEGFPYMEGLTEGTYQDHFLKLLTDKYLEKGCPYCNNKVPAEGIVIRIDKTEFEAYKLKSVAFLCKESAQLDAGEADIESSQDGE